MNLSYTSNRGNRPGGSIGPDLIRSGGGTALAYFLISLAGNGASIGIWETSLLSPANGFLLAMLLSRPGLSRTRILLMCLAGSALAYRLESKSVLPAYGFAMANMAEVGFALFLIGRLRLGSGFLADIHKTFLFQGAVAGTAAAGSALLAAGFLAAFSRTPFLETFLSRWAADSLGLAIVTPAVLAWFGPDLAWDKNRHRKAELLLCVATTVGFTAAIFLFSRSMWGPFGHPLPQAVLPLLLWAAMRFGVKGAMNLSLAVYFMAGWFTARGAGPIAYLHDSPLSIQGSLLVFQTVIALCTLIPAILINSRLIVLEKLRDRDFRYASMWASKLVGIYVTDLSGTVLEANDTFLAMVGYSHADMAAGEIQMIKLATPEYLAQAAELRALFRKDGKIGPFEREWVLRDGGRFRGVVFATMMESETAIGMVLDISDLEKAQKELRRSERLFRSLSEASLVGTLRLDTQGECTYANPKWLAMAGITEQESRCRSWRDAIHESDRYEVNAAWTAFLSGGPPVIRDYRLRKPDGTLTWVSSWSTDLKDEDGSRIGFLEKTIDITEHMRAKSELVSAIKAAESANQAKSQFLAHMSHEIRTPLNGVLGMLSLLRETPLTEEQGKYSALAKQSGEHLLSLIDQVLDFSKIESLHLRLDEVAFDLSDVLEGTLATVAGVAAEKGLNVVMAKDPLAPSRFLGDPVRLRQILVNLAGNAVKFSDRGEIGISVRMLSDTAEAAQLLFEVSDQGPGISPEIVGNLFQPFRQGDASLSRKAGGTGLGLAISKDLAALMDGRIWVESGPESGSRFRFTAHLRKASNPGLGEVLAGTPGGVGSTFGVGRVAKAGIRAENPAAGSMRANPRILLVDDHPTNLIVASAMLVKMGCAVDSVKDGKAALDAIAFGHYDLVLMDCQMPDLDGFQTTALIRGMPGPIGRTPIVALTAHAVDGIRERCLSAGMDDYISKPFTRERFRDILQGWIGYQSPEPDAAVREPSPGAGIAQDDGMDWSRLESLDDGTMKGRISVRELAALFLETVAKDLVILREFIAERRDQDLSRRLHRMKGACGTVGAARLKSLIDEMETCADRGELEAVSGIAVRMEAEISRTGESLRNRLEGERRLPGPDV